MGKLQTAVTLPKRILLQGWANDEDNVNINGEYTYTINFDISIIQGGPSAFYNGYKHNTLNAFIYFLGGWEFLTTANPNQWSNPSTNNVLPLTGWIQGNAQGPAGTITILENISGKNTKISIKKQNLGGGTLLINYIFDPKEIQGLSLWLKADAGVTLDGSNVIAWADQSGNGKNATAIESPTYATNSINGKPALVFANDSYLTTANIFNGANPRSMFAVYYIDSGEDSNTVVAQSNEDDTVMGTYFMLQSRIDQNSSPYLAGYVDDLSGPAFVSPELLIGMADYDGTTARLFKNGVEVNSDVKNYNTHNGQLYIGACNIAGAVVEYFGGKIAEIIIYNRILTTPERQQVETYLKGKYAITCGYQNINKLVEISGNNAPIGLTFNHIAFDYASFAGNCSALGLNPATILNDLGGVDFSSNYVIIRAKTSSSISADSISDLGDGIINITNIGPSQNVPFNYYRFFVMCKGGWNTVNFYGVNYPI